MLREATLHSVLCDENHDSLEDSQAGLDEILSQTNFQLVWLRKGSKALARTLDSMCDLQELCVSRTPHGAKLTVGGLLCSVSGCDAVFLHEVQGLVNCITQRTLTPTVKLPSQSDRHLLCSLNRGLASRSCHECPGYFWALPYCHRCTVHHRQDLQYRVAISYPIATKWETRKLTQFFIRFVSASSAHFFLNFPSQISIWMLMKFVGYAIVSHDQAPQLIDTSREVAPSWRFGIQCMHYYSSIFKFTCCRGIIQRASLRKQESFNWCMYLRRACL